MEQFLGFSSGRVGIELSRKVRQRLKECQTAPCITADVKVIAEISTAIDKSSVEDYIQVPTCEMAVK